MQVAGCESCKMYRGSTYVPPQPVCKETDAELFVILDSPNKFDARLGNYLSKEAGDYLFKLLDPYVDRSKVYVTSAVRCFQHKKNVKTPEAKKCYGQWLQQLVEWMRYDMQHPKKVLLLGFWPPKLILGHDLKEIGGQTVSENHLKFGVLPTPHDFITKYVRWTKDEHGNWVCPEGSQERARADWNRTALPVIESLFSARNSSIQVGATHKFPFTRVDDPVVMANMLKEKKGMLVGHDVEGYPSEAAKEMKHTALDWFYGADRCLVRSSSFSFFPDYASLGYTEGSTQLTYDPRNLVVYTGQPTVDIAKALHDTRNVMFNATFDSGVMYAHTGELVPIHADPCDMGYVVDQGRKKYGLKSLCYEWIPEFATYADEMKGKDIYENIALPKLWNYNAGDTLMMMILYWKFAYKIAQLNMNFLYWDIMAPVKTYLRDMEARGVLINRPKFAEVANATYAEVAATRNELYNHEIVGWWQETNNKPFNPNSPLQLGDIYARLYGPNAIKSTGKKILDNLLRMQRLHGKPECSFTKSLLKYRKAEKTRSTYVEGINHKVFKSIVYPSFKINTTETGRTSSGGGDVVGLGKTHQINIQNITRSSNLRAMFRARKDCYLAYADYGQIEIRVAGAYAESPEIRDICLSGRDFHGMTTATAYNLDYQWVMDEDAQIKLVGGTSFRTKGKTTAFGMLYGMAAEGLADQLNLRRADGSLDVEAAQALIDGYFAGMPAVKRFIDETHAFVSKNFYVETVFGRRRYFANSFAASFRESVNTKVQSAASDIFLMSLITTGDTFRAEKMYNSVVFPWAEVHDAITWEVHKSVPEAEIKEIMQECMVTKVRQRYPRVDEFLGEIPLTVDFKFDEVWH